jgi:hypothetical protein
MSSNKKPRGRFRFSSCSPRINQSERWDWRKLPTFEELNEATAGSAWNDTRPQEVERAKELIQDDQYPSEPVVRSIAQLLASHLGP